MEKGKKRLDDRIQLMLSIKAKGRVIDFDHILEKVSRNAGEATRREIRNALEKLLKEDFVEKSNAGWHITKLGRKKAASLANDPELNESYRSVFKARNYYSKMAPYILPFLKDRKAAVIKLFSNEDDPINKVKKVFSRFSAHKSPHPHHITEEQDIMKYVNAHTIEFLMVREENAKPDFYVITVKPGKELKGSKEERKVLGKVVQMTYNIMTEQVNLNPFITFSGDNEFNIFCKFTKSLGNWKTYRRATRGIKNLVEEEIERKNFKELSHYSPLNISLENDYGRIIFSMEGMKSNGTIIAPFSLHWKTRLASIPIKSEHIEDFQKKEAKPENVLENREKLNEIMKKTAISPDILARTLNLGLFGYF